MRLHFLGRFRGWNLGKRVGLSFRIVGGFAVVLALAALAIAVGYQGLSTVLGQVRGDRELGRLVMEIMNARLFEKQYMSGRDPAQAQAVQKQVALMVDGIRAAGENPDLAVAEDELGRVAGQVAEYGRGFADYVTLAREKEETLTGMTRAGRAAHDLAEQIGVEQRAALLAYQKDSSGRLEESMRVIDLAYRVKVDLTQARAMALAWELAPGEEAFDEWDLPNMRIDNDLDSIKELVTSDSDKKELAALSEAHGRYKDFTRAYMESRDPEKKAQATAAADRMIEATDKFLEGQTIIVKLLRGQMAEAMNKRLDAAGAAAFLVRRFLQVRAAEKDFVAGASAVAEQVRTGLAEMAAKIKALRVVLTSGDDLAKIEAMARAVAAYDRAFADFAAMTARQEAALADMNAKAEAAVKGCVAARGRQMAVMQGGMDRAKLLMAASGLAAVVIGLGLAWLINRLISRPLRQMAGSLDAGTAELKQAAQYVAGNSDNLARGTGHQAASLQETTAALEEMANMTRGNAESARKAEDLAAQAQAVIDGAAENMERMAASIKGLAESGGEIAKIVKSIDEIAFQTNLLALNAAVEAARAGEAGAGFAVVSGEVRNLAGRAGQAANHTQRLIETTVERIGQCAALVEQAQQSFGRVSQASGQQAGLIAEIAGASVEQSEGIEQIKQAVGQIDQVVQETAAGAEESASVAHTLNGQVAKLNDIISLVHVLLNGGDGAGASRAGGSLGGARPDTHLLEPPEGAAV